jgi:hypothetical protein
MLNCMQGTPFSNSGRSLIMPYIIYSNVAFSTRLKVVFNSCLGYVHDISRQEHLSHLIPGVPFDVFV